MAGQQLPGLCATRMAQRLLFFAENCRRSRTNSPVGALFDTIGCQNEAAMRTSVTVAQTRRVLCVFPAYAPSFGTFSHAYKLARWPVRFVDENIKPASAADLAWADVVLVSGMHIQAPQIRDIARRARTAGKVVALGGPSVSASPEMYPEIDYLH